MIHTEADELVACYPKTFNGCFHSICSLCVSLPVVFWVRAKASLIFVQFSGFGTVPGIELKTIMYTV